MPDTSPSLIPTQAQFTAVISELADQDLIEYFTNDAHLNQLVDWLNAETHVPKLIIRFSLKRIIPFILNKSAEMGNGIVQNWASNMHERMSEYSWYLNFCLKVLDVLKSKTDRAYGQVADTPTAANIQTLMADPARWENLADEQKYTLQLMLGYQHLTHTAAEHHGSLQHIQTLIGKLITAGEQRIPLDTPEKRIENNSQTNPDSVYWLTFAQRQIELIGRESALNWLNQFMNNKKNFSWSVVTGEGGVGKSRLAMEHMIANESLWDCGFVRADTLKHQFPTNWQPTCPTYWVIDYAATQPQAVKHWLQYCAKHQASFTYPVRILLLERASEGQSWWTQIMETGSSELRAVEESLYFGLDANGTTELKPLTVSEQIQALQAFLAAMDRADTALPEDDDWRHQLQELTHKGNPLFIGMVALAIAQKGIHGVRQWRRTDVLAHLLKHERTHWNNTLNNLQTDYGHFAQNDAHQLMALACIMGQSPDTKALSSMCTAANIDLRPNQASAIVRSLRNDKDKVLQPDLFAEYFVLHVQTGQDYERTLELMRTAHQHAPEHTEAFIERCAIDFPEDEQSVAWWRELYATEQSDALAEVLFNIAGRLRMMGKYIVASQWLLYVKDDEVVTRRARALNLLGMVNTAQGDYPRALKYLEESKKIRKDIGDRPGLGVTLNNISQIYHAQGDYTSALKYLEASKEIRENVGDHAGLGKTLNNISRIYYAQGDYAGALKYLEDSMNISKAVADYAGLSATLNNIGLVYKVQSEHPKALKCFEESKEICEKIGELAGLGTSLNNIASIYHDQGDYTRALKYFEASKKIREDIGDRAGLGVTLNNIASIYSRQREYSKALSFFEEYKDICEEIGDRAGLSFALFNLGQIGYITENAQLAFSCWVQSYQIAQAIGEELILGALRKLSNELGVSETGDLAVWAQLAESLDHNQSTS